MFDDGEIFDMSRVAVFISKTVGYAPRLNGRVDVVIRQRLAMTNRGHVVEMKVTDSKKVPSKKLLGFPASQDTLDTTLINWVRGLVQSNDQLADALECLRRSYRVVLAGNSVPDAAKVLWQVDIALNAAERSRNALAFKLPQGPESASKPRSPRLPAR
jgi:hypothetical protein